MISRRSSAYPTMILRASSTREGLGFGASLLGGSSGRFMVGWFKYNHKGRC
jgi:hypothetical protein